LTVHSNMYMLPRDPRMFHDPVIDHIYEQLHRLEMTRAPATAACNIAVSGTQEPPPPRNHTTFPPQSAPQYNSNAGQSDDASIVTKNNKLIVLSDLEGMEHDPTITHFCGTMLTDLSRLPSLCRTTVFLCGDIAKADGEALQKIEAADRVFIVRQLSHNYDESIRWPVVDSGRVPILLHGMGVYFRRFFEHAHSNESYFNRISTDHAFQALTESTKPGTAHRTGIYLTPVEQQGEDLHFRVLRCSSNLSGPTGNFRTTDRQIVSALNEEARLIFENEASMNHVLAQIYRNTSSADIGKKKKKDAKARIKAHSDKTKDMPPNGIMAFCTFYDQLDQLQPLDDGFDYGNRKGVSGLTRLHFKLKAAVAAHPGCTLTPEFSVTLYPNSVFFMPLSTNRTYTHEIRPGALNAELLPSRLGYVVRCSATEAVHSKGQTFLKLPHQCIVPLEPPTKGGMAELRALYHEENSSDTVVEYGVEQGRFLFSMNSGDYEKPVIYHMAEEFQSLTLHPEENLFEELLASAQFEALGKGRQGTVLVRPEKRRGVPIVRTTTKYSTPAQCFQPVHLRLSEWIERNMSLHISFNNALLETYTNAYFKMGFHSDQAQDLEGGSYIALFSCYKMPELAYLPRKLVVESKEGGGSFEIPLNHNSIVVWSLDTNSRFRHKIVLDMATHPPQNEWLGVTFRASKTFVKMHDSQVLFEDGACLTLADKEQQIDFFKLRGCENKATNFTYPKRTYTISKSDMMLPWPAEDT